MAKFCSRCGAAGVKLQGSFCDRCRAEMIQIEIPARLKIKHCKKCGAIFFRNKWAEESPEVLKYAIAAKLKEKISDISFLGNEVFFRLDETGKKDRSELEFEDIICPMCRQIMDKTYEIKIQVRAAEKTNVERFMRLVAFIKKQAHRHQAPQAASFWWEENRDGVDFFFGFRAVGDEILQQALHKFKISPLTSREFHGFSRDQKKKVSTTYCLRV